MAYFIGVRRTATTDDTDTASAIAPDPGYAARDAQLIETGYDGRERYRLNARVIRQRTESGVIELEDLAMNYHVESAGEAAGRVGARRRGVSRCLAPHLRSRRGARQWR